MLTSCSDLMLHANLWFAYILSKVFITHEWLLQICFSQVSASLFYMQKTVLELVHTMGREENSTNLKAHSCSNGIVPNSSLCKFSLYRFS